MGRSSPFSSSWRLDQANAPGGWGIGFGATKRAVGELNDRVTEQMGTINDRLYDLEKVVFKDDAEE